MAVASGPAVIGGGAHFAEAIAGCLVQPACRTEAVDQLAGAAVGLPAGITGVSAGGAAAGTHLAEALADPATAKATEAMAAQLQAALKAPSRIFTTADVAAPSFASFEARASVLNNFKGGIAVETTYGGGARLYRIGDRNGAYWAIEPPPTTELQWRMDYAVQGEWNNMSNLYIIDIPKGSSLSGLEGIVGAQRGALYGGKKQVFIDWKNVPEDWITTTPLRK